MPDTLTLTALNLDYYNYAVIGNFVFEVQKPVISGSYEYEENGVYYCATATEKGVYRYSYARNSPLMYTDPSGEFFWFFPSINWSKDGGVGIGLNFIVGIPGIFNASASLGFNPQSSDLSVTIGVTAAFNTLYASLGTQSGFSVGWSVGLSPQLGLPISSNLTSFGVNYNVTNGVLSGNISALCWGPNGVSFNPSFSAMILPEQFTNLVKGGGFRSNSQVFDRMMSGTKTCQDILDYFGFKGTYNPKETGGAPGVTDDKTGKIFYNDFPFQGNYDRLAFIAYHEMRHSRNILSGKYKDVDFRAKINKPILAREEWDTYLYNYRNQGLYPNHGVNLINRIGLEGMDAGIYGVGTTDYFTFTPEWWHFIYKIPRLW